MTCKFCGAQLPEGATFCPSCNKSQIEKTELRAPKPRKKKLLILCAVLVLVIAAAAVAVSLTGEQTEAPGFVMNSHEENREGIGMVTLTDSTGHYEVALCSDGSGLPNKSFDITVFESSGTANLNCQLIVTKDGEFLTTEFVEALKSISVEIIDAVGTPMTATEPAASEAYPNAALFTMVTADIASESATLLWTGETKSGITFTIRQKLTVDPAPAIRYFAEDYAMTTDEELDALLAEILETTPENALIQLFLPGVTYEQPHTFADRSYQVLGSVEDDNVTTFLAPVTFSTEGYARTDIQNARLQGSGSGAAVTTNNYTTLYFCTISDWETGAEATGSGSINLQDCSFANNQVAVRWNAESLYVFNGSNQRTAFTDNGTALDLQNVPAKLPLSFLDCTFSGNGTDIRNENDYPVDLTDANME